MAPVFYKEILDARTYLKECVLRESDYHPRILYPAKLSHKFKEEERTFPNRAEHTQKTSSHAFFLRNLLKDVLQQN